MLESDIRIFTCLPNTLCHQRDCQNLQQQNRTVDRAHELRDTVQKREENGKCRAKWREARRYYLEIYEESKHKVVPIHWM